jgi:hypothetical protein
LLKVVLSTIIHLTLGESNGTVIPCYNSTNTLWWKILWSQIINPHLKKKEEEKLSLIWKGSLNSDGQQFRKCKVLIKIFKKNYSITIYCVKILDLRFHSNMTWIEALKSLYRSPGNKKKQLVLCKNYVLQW